MADSFQSYKVTNNEQSSATKFNNLVQALEDAINSLDDSNVASAAAIAVSKLAAGSNGDVLTTTTGVPTWAPAASSSNPSGMVVAYAGSSAPTGWLLCDGTAVSRTTYATLFGIIGTAYGVGDGSLTFNLPDFQGRMPVGKGTHVDVDTLGENEGASLANRTPSHHHLYYPAESVGGYSGSGYGANPTPAQAKTTGNANLQDKPAYLVVNYIVKT